MPDKLEIKQIPEHIVRAFVAKYGKIGQSLDETDWLDLFGVWYAGWLAGAESERNACATILDEAVAWYDKWCHKTTPHNTGRNAMPAAIEIEANKIRARGNEQVVKECSTDTTK